GHAGRGVRDRRRRRAPRGHLRRRQGRRGDPRVHAEVGGGEGGIRTPEALARLLVFKTSATNRSATSPRLRPCRRLNCSTPPPPIRLRDWRVPNAVAILGAERNPASLTGSKLH